MDGFVYGSVFDDDLKPIQIETNNSGNKTILT